MRGSRFLPLAPILLWACLVMPGCAQDARGEARSAPEPDRPALDAGLARHVRVPGCEPLCLRQVYRVEKTGRSYYFQWMIVSAPGPSLGGKVSDGFLDAASVRIYRPDGRRVRRTDTGTVGLFRGTRNGWLTSGHGGKMARGVGDNPPFGPRQPVILLREDWLDLQPGDIVVVERRAGTTDGRILNGLELGDRALPWQCPDKDVDIDLLVHDPRALAEADDWTTHGQGCLRIDNAKGKAAARVAQQAPTDPPPAGRMTLAFWARARTRDDGPARIELRWGDGEAVGVAVSPTWSRHVATLGVDSRRDAQRLNVTVPPRCTLWLDQFTSPTHPQPAPPGKTYAPLQAGPAAASLLGPAPSTTVDVDLDRSARGAPGKPRLRSAAGETLPVFLARRASISDEEIVLAFGPLHDEQSWRNLVEYLAAPYDPDRDSPRTKPYAYRRAVRHGRPRPWTEAFGAIVLDVAPRGMAPGPALEAASRLAGHVAGDVLPETPYWRAAGGKLRASASRARPAPSTASMPRPDPRESRP